jgi:hypothetical protein
MGVVASNLAEVNLISIIHISLQLNPYSLIFQILIL